MRFLERPSVLLTMALALLLAIALAGCATSSFNAQAATAMRSVTAARATSTDLLNAKKITSAQHKAIEMRLDAVAKGIADARAQCAVNPSLCSAGINAGKAEAEAIDKKLKE